MNLVDINIGVLQANGMLFLVTYAMELSYEYLIIWYLFPMVSPSLIILQQACMLSLRLKCTQCQSVYG